jgi:hypothetical protein
VVIVRRGWRVNELVAKDNFIYCFSFIYSLASFELIAYIK